MGNNFSLNCCSPDLYPNMAANEREIQGANKPRTKLSFDEDDKRSKNSNQMNTNSSDIKGRPSTASQFILDDYEVSVHILLGQNYYYTLCQNEDIAEFFKPLESFSINSLVHIVYAIYEISVNLIDTVQTKKILEFYKSKLNDFFEDEIKFHTDIGERGEYIKAICYLAEVYHYFKYWLSGQKGAYIIYFWEKVPDKEEYFFDKINEIRSILIKLLGSNMQ